MPPLRLSFGLEGSPSALGCQSQKVGDDFVPVLGCDAFGMELYAVEGERFVLDGHDNTVLRICGDFEFGGAGFGIDHKRMVACHGHRRRQASKNASFGVGDFRGFAVDGLWRTDDFTAEGLPHGLMSQTDAEHRNFGFFVEFNEVEAYACFAWATRARGQDDGVGFFRDNFLSCCRVVADDSRWRAQIAAILGYVVGEAVVIVY